MPKARKPPTTSAAAKTLRASEELFALVFQRSPDAMAISRLADGTILEVNEEFERQTGYSRADVIGKNTVALGLLPSDEDRADLLARVASGERVRAHPFPFRTQQGVAIVGALSASPIELGGEQCILVSVRDVTEQRRVEASLRTSEARYRALVDDQMDFVVRWLPDGTRTFVNQEYCRHFGGTPADHIGSSFYPLIAPEDRERIREKIAGLTPEHPTATADHRVHLPDGTVGWNQWTDRASFDAEGNVIEMLSVGRDITEQHEARELLRVSEARFRTLAEAAFEGIGVSQQGVVVDCNPRLAELLGYPIADLIGASVIELVAPVDRTKVSAYLATQDRAPYEHLARRRDGTEFPVEVQGRALPGAPGLRVTAIRDITERRQAEETLQRKDADYRALVEHANYGIYRSTPEGKFIMVNPALVQMLGYASADDLLAADLGRDVYVEPAERGRLMHAHADVERITPVECPWRRRDGSVMTVRLSGRVVRDLGGAIECYEMIAEDVTQQHHLEAQLRQAQKMEAVGQLTTGIAHDFNNMLAVILANAQLLANAPPEALAAGLTEIEQAALQGAAIVRQLLGFARRADLTLAPARLDDALRHLEPMLRRLIPKDIEVHVTIGERLAASRADSQAVEQILLNLVMNARDAMPNGGLLTMKAENARLDDTHRERHPWVIPGEYVCLSVQDSGHGMDAITQQRIFEPFFTTKPPGLGTGLGLSMVYGLMKQHDGMVDVQSTPERGTTVQLYFPAVTGTASPVKEAVSTSRSEGGSETILLVDDEDGLRRTGQRALERFGYTVLTARDGAEALEVYQRNASIIDLVVSDLAMPRLDGWGLYRALHAEGKQVKFVLASGRREADTQERLSIAMTVPFLQKPWTLDELARQVRQVLDTTD